MNRVDPGHVLGLLDRLDIEIDDDGLVVAADNDAFERLVGGGVDLLVRHEGRHEDEVAGAGLGDEFEAITPPHPSPALDDVDDAFERAVMVGARLGIGVYGDGAGPDLLGTDAREIDGGGAAHARRLGGVGVEPIAGITLTPCSFQSMCPVGGSAAIGGHPPYFPGPRLAERRPDLH